MNDFEKLATYIEDASSDKVSALIQLSANLEDQLDKARNDLRESEQCREELHARLREVAIALKGPEGKHQIHGFVDLPKLADIAQRDAKILEALRQALDAAIAAEDQ